MAKKERIVVGVDVGATRTKAQLFKFGPDGTLKAIVLPGKRRGGAAISFKTSRKPQTFEGALMRVVKRELGKLENPVIAALGVAFPCPVDEEGNLGQFPNLHPWSNYASFRGRFVKAFPTAAAQIALVNDGNAAAYGEFCARSADGARIDNLVMATLGSGVGGGIIHRRRLLGGRCGEIGHISVCPSHVNEALTKLAVCGCGCCNHLEALAGRCSLPYYLSSIPRQPSSNVADPDWLSGFWGFLCVGDDYAREVFRLQARALGIGLASAAAIAAPDLIVIGGGGVNFGEQADLRESFLGEVRGAYAGNVKPDFSDCPVELAVTGNGAGALGAALLALGDSKFKLVL